MEVRLRDFLMLFHRYRRPEDAKMALEQMDGFELAGRTVCHYHDMWTSSYRNFASSV